MPQLNTALHPSDFEKESFRPEIIVAFNDYKNVVKIKKDCFLFPWLELRIFYGHTVGLIVPVIHNGSKTIVFVGDLLPSAAHLILNSVMGYDINPELVYKERNALLNEAYKKGYLLFFQHDLYYECCSLKFENNYFQPDKFSKISDL